MRLFAFVLWLAAVARCEATAGIALSGGGIIAMLSSMCSLKALEEIMGPAAVAGIPVAMTSGGTVGSVLYATKGANLSFPPSWRPADYDEQALERLSQRFAGNSSGSVWFAAITELFLGDSTRLAAAAALLSPAGGLLSHAADPAVMLNPLRENWWADALAAAALLYKTRASELVARPGATGTVTLLRAAAAPLQRDPATHVMLHPPGALFPAEWHPATASIVPVGATAPAAPPPLTAVSNLDAVAWSTSFWAASILESPALFALAGRLVPRAPKPHDDFILVDGGTIDSTAIAALLRRSPPPSRIVAFYEDAVDVRAVSAQLGYVFGVQNVTTDLAMWEGPALGQLFPAEHWPAVLANLSDPKVAFASLRDVPVLGNAYLGVPGGHVLEELLVVAVQQGEAFLEEMDAVDPRVRRGLHAGWPEAMPLLGMSPLDANALCMYAGWSVHRHREPILRALRV